ncbi:ABC transporter substrate-binding protein [Plastoroseomonas arctica]|uniref:ABC transporter substrate-binding protein n=1 Tax=Plastoroseomonas arctica TaxID=1509237 RepID=A0AAF1K1E5_9PROT|nr:ABC transporter substrate-binding protein [Plastoroseomonas arctica]MBR0654575.1 ABC transporter substrate-binding protein [Plastoroseomonas arctica]
MHRRTLFGIGAGLLAAPRIATAQAARTLRFVPQADLTVLDPIWTAAHVTRHHSYLVFDTLFGQDSRVQVSHQMLAGHVVEADGLRWTLTLRDGLRFHDGEPVLARDCVASIRRWGRRDILGRLLMARVEDLSAPDDRSIVFRLSRPFPQLPLALGKAGSNLCAIMPERLARIDAFTQITEMVGSGPFRFLAAEQIAGARVVYERFAGYRPQESGTPDFMAGPKIVHLDRVEWLTNPDPGTAAAALQAGEVDWVEQPLVDLLPLLRRHRGIQLETLDPLGSVGIMRLNALHPPFNNPAIRQALLHAVNQSDFMRAVAGDDTSLWRDGVGMFCPESPSASDAGMEVIAAPRDIERARREIIAAGYRGEPLVLLAASDIASLKAASEVAGDMLRRVGLNVDYQAMDWGTVVQRRAKREAPEAGGWNAFCTFNSGLDQASPATHAWLATSGASAAPGWPDDPALEALRVGWLDAPDPMQVAQDIQRRALRAVPYVPIGQYFNATAFRRNLSGILRGFPVFWNIRKA